jgi:hypothetical protein
MLAPIEHLVHLYQSYQLLAKYPCVATGQQNKFIVFGHIMYPQVMSQVFLHTRYDKDVSSGFRKYHVI